MRSEAVRDFPPSRGGGLALGLPAAGTGRQRSIGAEPFGRMAGRANQKLLFHSLKCTKKKVMALHGLFLGVPNWDKH